jgi:hypothetical protein
MVYCLKKLHFNKYRGGNCRNLIMHTMKVNLKVIVMFLQVLWNLIHCLPNFETDMFETRTNFFFRWCLLTSYRMYHLKCNLNCFTRSPHKTTKPMTLLNSCSFIAMLQLTHCMKLIGYSFSCFVARLTSVTDKHFLFSQFLPVDALSYSALPFHTQC